MDNVSNDLSTFVSQPDDQEAATRIACGFFSGQDFAEAEKWIRRSLYLDPHDEDILRLSGHFFRELGRLRLALHYYALSLKTNPEQPETLNAIGFILSRFNRTGQSLSFYDKALYLDPGFTRARSNLIFTKSFFRRCGLEQELLEAQKWEQGFLASGAAKGTLPEFRNHGGRGRKVRLGVLSSELRGHPVSFFLYPLLKHLDRSRFELHLYATVKQRDEVTEKFKSISDSFTSLHSMDSREAAGVIRGHGMDVLMDTSGHSNHSHMRIACLRAAPVQCHYLGYFGTTGLGAMDYFIADQVLVPEGMDRFFSETVYRLNRPWISYAPLEEAPPPRWMSNPGEELRLGSLNTPAKTTEATLDLWAGAMRALPQSILLLKNNDDDSSSYPEFVSAVLSRRGIDPRRVRYTGRTRSWAEHMDKYNLIDIALDSIPLNSGTTAFDTLWMGTPMVTLAGDWFGGRMAASILDGLGRPEWIARDNEEFVQKVVDLAGNAELRKRIRLGQRQKMLESPLCDARSLAREMERAFEAMLQAREDRV